MSASKATPLIEAAAELPEGWVLTRLSVVCEINPPKVPLDSLEPDQPVTFVPMPAVDAHRGAITAAQERPFSEVRRGFTSFRDEDVIMAKITPCMENGKAAIARNLVNGLGFGSTEFHVLRPRGAVLPEFIHHFIRQESFRRDAEAEMTGSVGQKRVPLAFLEAKELPLPPRAEQMRIVERVEQLLTRVKATRERLVHIPAVLKRFRQAVLAAACSGRLTADWREDHSSVEPAAGLLYRVEHELNHHNKKKQVNDFIAEEQYDLPDTWASSTLDQIFSVETGGTPLRSVAAYYENGTIPWVKTGEVHNCEIANVEEFITPLAIQETNVKVFPAGTILIAMYGEGKTRGQVGRLRIDAATNQACAALVNPSLPPPMADYVYYYCLGQYSRLRSKSFGGNQPNLNLGIIKSWTINIPPLQEQHEIVRCVEALFKLADTIEKRVAVSTARTEKLKQAILAKAFRGELVPTEAELARIEGRSCESADELLTRIRSEQTDQQTQRFAKRTSKTSAQEEQWPKKGMRKTRKS
jgi:type I restriction enzyme S subunit